MRCFQERIQMSGFGSLTEWDTGTIACGEMWVCGTKDYVLLIDAKLLLGRQHRASSVVSITPERTAQSILSVMIRGKSHENSLAALTGVFERCCEAWNLDALMCSKMSARGKDI